MMKLGAFSLSLTVKDLQRSKEFYTKLGFEVMAGSEEQNYLIMRNEQTVIGLFQGMFENNILTFNPGWNQNGENLEEFMDIRKIHSQLSDLTEDKIESESGPASFMIADPDGNQILFDQHR